MHGKYKLDLFHFSTRSNWNKRRMYTTADIMHDRWLRKTFVNTAYDVLRTRGLPDDIIGEITETKAYAANIIRRVARNMINERRNVRMSIRWFRMNEGHTDPVFICNHGWQWVDRADLRMSATEEFKIVEIWQRAGRPKNAYVPRAVSVSTMKISRKKCVHYSEFHSLRRKTKRARRVLPHTWGG